VGLLGDEVPVTPYHHGIIVDDLDTAKEQYTAVWGCSWTEEDRFFVTVVVDGVEQESEIRFVYSQQGPPYVELLEEISGNAWRRPDGKLDHIGYWSDDLPADVAELHSKGFPAVVHGGTVAEPALFSCHRVSAGFWVELVPSSWKADLAAWIARSK